MIANISDRKDTKYFDSSKHYKEKPPNITNQPRGQILF